MKSLSPSGFRWDSIPWTVTERRSALRWLVGGLLSPLAGCAGFGLPQGDDIVLAAGKQGGQPMLAAWQGDAELLYIVPMPARLHGFARRPASTEAVVFDRRPGRSAHVFDKRTGRLLHRIQSPVGRHFQGHGSFSRNGTVLYASENDPVRGRGVIGMYAADRGYRRVGEFDSGGIGPHEIISLNRQDALVVANGGVLTRPETGRAKLNPDTMQTSLVTLDCGNGHELDRFEPDVGHRQFSIRHLAVAEDDSVGFAAQYYGNASDQPPLVGIRRPGEDPQWLSVAPDLRRSLKNYIGSVAINHAGDCLLASAPRGNRVVMFDLRNGRTEEFPCRDGSGLIWKDRGYFWLSAGTGEASRLHGDVRQQFSLRNADSGFPRVWDNHLG